MRNYYGIAMAVSAMMASASICVGGVRPGAGEIAPSGPKFAYKAQGGATVFETPRMQKINSINSRIFGTKDISKRGIAGKKSVMKAPDFQLPASDDFDYLDAPDGSVWFYSTQLDYDVIEHEMYTERLIKGFTFTIYDSNLKEVGIVKDKVELQGDETRIASLSLAPVVTKKFFNSNDKYEVMVALMCNNPDYSITGRTLAYTIGGEKDEDGNDKSICTIDGILCDVLNASPDAWSETFYLAFEKDYSEPISDDATYQEMLESYYINIDVYGKAGWNTEPKKIFTKTFQNVKLPGDQMNSSPVISKFEGGKAYFVVNEYEKNLYNDQESPFDENFSQAEGNNLVITVYQLNTSGADEVQVTKIPVIKDTTDGVQFSYYGIGGLGYRDDVDFTHYGTPSGQAAFVITKWNYLISNDDSYDKYYYVYDNEGVRKLTLFELADSALEMSDVDGFDRQYMFVKVVGEEYEYHFVNIVTGETECEFNYNIPYEEVYEMISANLDRYPVGNSYNYVAEIRHPEYSDGHDVMRFAWINTDGEMDHVDNVDMGVDVAMAQSYISQSALNPYLFDTDAAHEYMLLVKRYNDAGTAPAELLIAGTMQDLYTVPGPTPLLHLTADDEKSINQIVPLNFTGDAKLMVLWTDGNQYYQDFYNLPFRKFQGGDGSASNPYQIATAGDLKQIQQDLAANYIVVNDIDASGVKFTPMGSATLPFTGTLDGQGHEVKNVVVNGEKGSALFSGLHNATVKNLNFRDASVRIAAERNNALLATSALNSRIENVHVLGLNAAATSDDADALVGGLVASMTNGSVITGSSVSNANIYVPGSTDFYGVGGLVGQTRTGSSILASSFVGTIEAGSTVGGIAGTTDKDGSILNCHVDVTLKAKNTVGGIVGSSSRTLVQNCHVEGEIIATENTRNGGLKAGGVIGALARYYGESEEGMHRAAGETPIVVKGNYVNVSLPAPLGEGDIPANENSVHRIVGFSSINMLEIDWDNTNDYQNPIYLTPVVEEGLSDNYAHENTLLKGEAAHTSTDGATVAASDLNTEFFQGLGFGYGDTEDSPWRDTPADDPSLHHEIGARFAESTLRVEEGKTFTAELIVVGRTQLTEEQIGSDLTVDSSDENVVSVNGNMSVKGNVLTIGMEAIQPGTATITATVNGSATTLVVTVDKAFNSIDSVVSGKDSVMSYDGASVNCAGAQIDLYNLSGVKMASAADSVKVSGLAAGVYVAMATLPEGEMLTLKIVVK